MGYTLLYAGMRGSVQVGKEKVPVWKQPWWFFERAFSKTAPPVDTSASTMSMSDMIRELGVAWAGLVLLRGVLSAAGSAAGGAAAAAGGAAAGEAAGAAAGGSALTQIGDDVATALEDVGTIALRFF